MKLIALAGLVSIEKINLTVELSQYFSEERHAKVFVIDTIKRMGISSELLGVPHQRITEPMLDTLAERLQDIEADIVLWAVDETVSPEALFLALDGLYDTAPQIDVQTLALIDLRTCDCFPQTRKALEAYADVALLMPYDLEDIIKHVDYSTP